MYTIYIDDILLYSTGLEDDDHIILDPKLFLDVNGSGSLTFVMKPGHVLYDRIKKLKSIITVQWDTQVIFRGRVMDDTKDFYGQKSVYCEGDKSFLLDSIHKSYKYSGSVHGFFRQLIDNHNRQVDAEKRFTVGIITAVSASETMEAEDDYYCDTAGRIKDALLSAYDGWLRSRTENGVTYLDWLAKDGNDEGQAVEFSVNLLDLEEKLDASEVFTVLIPLGASEINDDGEFSEPLTVSSVNGGLDYIQDDERVALYGKIWKTYTWSYVNDPHELLEKARKRLQTGMVVQTLTLKFIDMHFTDSSRKMVLIGDHPHIYSQPHGLDIMPLCVKADLDLIDPDNSMYTFGEAPRTLTDNYIATEEDVETLTGGGGGGGGGKSVKEELKDYIRWAEIRANEDEALIELLTGEASKLGERLSKAEVTLDGVNAQIVLCASKEEVDELGRRVSSAEIEIDGANAEIKLKVSKDGVISSINQSAESVVISASKINLSGYVTASQLSSLEADLASVTSGTVQASHLYTQNLTATNTVRLAGHTCVWSKLEVVTDVSLSKTYTTVPGGNGMDYVVIGGVSLNKTTEEIKYMGR